MTVIGGSSPAVALRTIETREQLQRVWEFAVRNLSLPAGKHTHDYYLEQLSLAPGLLVFAEAAGEVCGCVLGSIEDDHVLIGAVAVADSRRRQGIGAAMMRREEEEARRLGQTTLLLGAREEAEAFYLDCGSAPHLFIQAPAATSPAELRALAEGCEVAWEAQEADWSKLLLRLPAISRDLQQRYETAFPGCVTQYVFTKRL